MRKIGLLLIALLVTVVFVKAQPGNFDPEAMVKRQLDGIVEACGLDKEQAKKVEAIIRKGNEKRMEMFQDMGGGDREAMRAKMTEFQENQTKEIKAVLTADQSKKYDKYLEEQAERRRERGGFGG